MSHKKKKKGGGGRKERQKYIVEERKEKKKCVSIYKNYGERQKKVMQRIFFFLS